MVEKRVYLHGQILGTHLFLLRDGFPEKDEYAELSQKYFLPGGETGTAATVLASLGVKVKMDGTHLDAEVVPSGEACLQVRGSSPVPVTAESAYIERYIMCTAFVKKGKDIITGCTIR